MNIHTFSELCNGKSKRRTYYKLSRGQLSPITHNCHHVHHNDPYMAIGPFSIEVISYWPLRTIFHNFYTDDEMQWMISYSRPRLSTAREAPEQSEYEKGSNTIVKNLFKHGSVI